MITIPRKTTIARPKKLERCLTRKRVRAKRNRATTVVGDIGRALQVSDHNGDRELIGAKDGTGIVSGRHEERISPCRCGCPAKYSRRRVADGSCQGILHARISEHCERRARDVLAPPCGHDLPSVGVGRGNVETQVAVDAGRDRKTIGGTA